MADESAYYDKLAELQAHNPDAATAMEAQRMAGPQPKQAAKQQPPQQPASRKPRKSKTIAAKHKKSRVTQTPIPGSDL